MLDRIGEESWPPMNPFHPEARYLMVATAELLRSLCRFLPPATRSEFWGGLAFLAVSLLGTAWVLKCRAEALALEQDSVNMKGKVVRLWMTKVKSHRHYWVEYEYPASPEAEARTLQDRTELSEEHFDRLKEGGPITVKVCRADPANHQAVGERPRLFSSIAALLFCLGLFALPALAGVINLGWWCICRGQPRPAQVFVVDVQYIQWQVRPLEGQRE
jgi:hypothetical protein